MHQLTLLASIFILAGVLYLTRGIKKMSAALDKLTQEVTETKAVSASVLTLVSGLADQIRANADNEAALNALADELDANEQALAAAVAANTPTPPAEPPAEPTT